MSNARKISDLVSASPTEDFNFDNGVFVVDISTNRVGVGITAPTEALQVAGNVKVADGGTIGSATTAGAITIASDGIVTLVDDLKIKDGGTIGSATTAGAITIASDGGITFAGDSTLATNKKVKQKGAFLQSSTHQAIFLGA